MNAVILIFLGIVLIQYMYYLFFSIALLQSQKLKSRMAAPVSVVIAARNEEKNLKKLLPALQLQKHPQFEVVVVDDRSNDNTYPFLLETSKQVDNLKIVRVDHTPDHLDGKKYALTLGIKAAKNESILFTDADCIPKTDQWISRMSSAVNGKDIFTIGYSQYRRKKGLLNLFVRFETLLTGIQYIALALLGKPYMGVGRNLAYKKSFFLAKKGFNRFQGLLGGDDDLMVNQFANKHNTRVSIGKEAMTTSEPKQTWKSFFVQKTRHLSVGKHYKTSDKFVLGLFTVTHIFTWLGLAPALQWGPNMIWPLPVLGLRYVLILMTFIIARKKFGDRFEWWWVPFLDIIFVFYYIFTAAKASFSKNVRWS